MAIVRVTILLAAISGTGTASLYAQPKDSDSPPPTAETPGGEELTPAAQKVDVNPVARDEEIRERLQSVLEATEWFADPQVRVDDGVVFLTGTAPSAELKKWAGDLARNTQDSVAVVNRMEVTEPAIWDFTPAWNGLWNLWREIVRSLPFILFALLVLALSYAAGMIAARAARWTLRRQIPGRLLLNVVARAIGVLVFLMGTYIILRVAGLTQLALSVVGGTGLIGLALGIAFRDITENFLASIFLSLQKPFETGDLVEVAGIKGFVQQLNIRTTMLMTLEGHLVQIPNASVYKSNLRNLTTNPNLREDFVVGIGYDDLIPNAQEIARKILEEHPAVLNDPEPWVLVDNLGASTVNLKIYFWLDSRTHSNLKVRSSVIRLVKAAFQKNGISMPDEAREVVFPRGIPVTVSRKGIDETSESDAQTSLRQAAITGDGETVSTKAEAGLSSEAPDIKEQARQVQPLKEAENLLRSSGSN